MGSSMENDKLGALAFEQAKQEELLAASKRKFELPTRTELAEQYQNSDIGEKIKERRRWGRRPVILFTDIDNTFYREDRKEDMLLLKRAIDESQIGLVYITGRRDFHKYEGDIPKPDILVGAAGTEIYICKIQSGC